MRKYEFCAPCPHKAADRCHKPCRLVERELERVEGKHRRRIKTTPFSQLDRNTKMYLDNVLFAGINSAYEDDERLPL